MLAVTWVRETVDRHPDAPWPGIGAVVGAVVGMPLAAVIVSSPGDLLAWAVWGSCTILGYGAGLVIRR